MQNHRAPHTPSLIPPPINQPMRSLVQAKLLTTTIHPQPVGTPLLELLHSTARPTARRMLPLEYYSLPPETKAELLATLCDDLLDLPTVQVEFERRELRGEFVTGEGGEDGAFAIRTTPKPQEVLWALGSMLIDLKHEKRMTPACINTRRATTQWRSLPTTTPTSAWCVAWAAASCAATVARRRFTFAALLKLTRRLQPRRSICAQSANLGGGGSLQGSGSPPWGSLRAAALRMCCNTACLQAPLVDCLVGGARRWSMAQWQQRSLWATRLCELAWARCDRCVCVVYEGLVGS